MSHHAHVHPTCPVLTPDHTLQPFGSDSAQLLLSRQAAHRFAQAEAVAARRQSQRSRPRAAGSLWQRASRLLSRPRSA